MKLLKKIIVKEPQNHCPSEINIKKVALNEHFQAFYLGIKDGKMYIIEPESNKFGTCYLIENEQNVFVEACISVEQHDGQLINFNLSTDEFYVIAE